MIRLRAFASFTFAALILMSLAPLAVMAQKQNVPRPDYFPLRVGDWWKYRSTNGEGKQSEFAIKVLSEEKQVDGRNFYLVETLTTFQPIHDWYSKPSGQVLMHRIAYPSNEALKADYLPVKLYLQNPLTVGSTWQWSGKGMMGVDIEESSRVTGPELVVVPSGKFQAMKVETRVIQGGMPVTKTYWFASWVGMVKSMTDAGPIKSTAVLLDYSFKKR
ncbi:hypothetical protein [Cyanobium sp. ATX 6F1]|uniref:hypothetical protein n=1 Tax=Cyanobium sp. ATX 6F1 TaxID=2823702 RepID=UPI0020CCFC5A|nr:hypothetical protein [Cyanobium sp. ATX 6F1]MCP9915971.1 hypothetical protein [Cyanobium sp. ATX 6F1]